MKRLHAAALCTIQTSSQIGLARDRHHFDNLTLQSRKQTDKVLFGQASPFGKDRAVTAKLDVSGCKRAGAADASLECAPYKHIAEVQEPGNEVEYSIHVHGNKVKCSTTYCMPCKTELQALC